MVKCVQRPIKYQSSFLLLWDLQFHLSVASFYVFFLAFLQVVFSTFEAQPLSDEEGDAIKMEEEAANFGIKYLTSSKLMGLEVSIVWQWTCINMQKFDSMN